jgi:hypothetical protein
MRSWTFAVVGLALFLAAGLYFQLGAEGQQPAEQEPAPVDAQALPPVPQGVEVMARGPVHEAFASPTSEPKATPVVPKKPPEPLAEMPPDQRPEGDVVWIAGYWAWDEDRNDYLWVSGCWRSKPPDKEWVPGYWREEGQGWQWVPGFWQEGDGAGKAKAVTYFPEPPTPPQVAPSGAPPAADTFYVPGYWVWNGGRYVWHAGYWARVQPGYVWVSAHYRWTPYGYVYVAGYWDLAVARRGMLYAPVVVDAAVVPVGFVYTPAYAVSDGVVLDTLFVRPCYGCYYFGDYYGPRYAGLGFESCVVYSRRHYDSIVVYECWEHRAEPRWLDVRVNLCVARDCGRAPLPPRTLVQQNIYIQNNITINRTSNTMQVLAPASRVAAAQGRRMVVVDQTTRVAAKVQAEQVRTSAIQQRRQTETPASPGSRLTAPRSAALNVPASRAVAPQGGLSTISRTSTTTSSVQRRSVVQQQSVRPGTTSTPGHLPPVSSSPLTNRRTGPPSGPYGSGGNPWARPGYPSANGVRPAGATGRDAYGRPLPNNNRPSYPPSRPAPRPDNQKDHHSDNSHN